MKPEVVRIRRLSLLLGLVLLLTPRAVVAQDLPISGTAVPSLASFDQAVTQLMMKWQIPGGAVAVAKDGRLIFARGYGRADVEANQLVQPDSRFRIASISKPVTAAAILKLVEEDRLNLDAKAFTILDQLRPPAGATVDPRVADITVRHLLHHGGGWDRRATFDPVFMPYLRQAAAAVGASEPATCETVIRFMLGRPLDFSPSTQYAYSNLGYCVLGRIIEKVTGQRYEEYVQSSVLTPAGIRGLQVGRTKLEERASGEVRYYVFPGSPSGAPWVFPGAGTAPIPYGGSFYMEGFDAVGGWIGSPIDLIRFVYALEGRKGTIFRSPQTLRLMLARPIAPLGTFTYVGTGVRTEFRDGALVIVEVFENGPAWQAGLRSNDVITAIDGRETSGRTIQEITQVLRGQEGTTVELSIQLPGTSQLVTVSIVRQQIVSPLYYAMGWLAAASGNGLTWWHEGSLPGTMALVARAAEGSTWAAFFNSRPRDGDGFLGELDAVLWQAARQVTEWPSHDLFSQYP